MKAPLPSAKTEINSDIQSSPAFAVEYDHLQQAKTELELAVQERTAELQNINRQLQQELAERKQTEEILQQSLQQLEMAYEQAKIYARELTAEIGERKWAEEQIRQNAARAEALARIAARLNAPLDLEAVLNTVCEETASALNASAAAVRLYDEQSDTLYYASAFGLTPNYSQYTQPSPRSLYDELFSQQGTFIVAPDVQAISSVPNATLYASLNIRTVVSVSMEYKRQLIGVLSIFTIGEVRHFTDDELTLLKGLGDQAAQAIANARLFAETERRAREFAALYETVYNLATQQDLPTLLETIVERAMGLVAAPGGVIFLYDAKGHELVVAVTRSFPRPIGTRMQWGEGMAGRVAQTRHPLIIDNYATWEHRSPQFEGAGLSAVVGVPILFGGELIGVLAAVELGIMIRKFTEVDARLLTLFAGQAASAVHNARLFEAVQQELAERKQAEQALEEERALLAQRVAERTAELSAVNAELARSARAKDEFLASMSHELRTPLNAILGLTEALQEQTRGPLNERQLKSLRTVEESGRHLLSLINDILDLSKIEAGKLELQLDLTPIEVICQASLQFVKEAAAKKKIGISFTMDNIQATMQVDVRRLKQILVNLLNNAVKFTPEGGQVGLTVTGEAEREVIHFMIWDTGIGIAPEDLSRLFKPFVQVDSSLSRQHEGTGLGLALVTRLVELHGGSIAVESEPGQGSRFIVSLPWHEALELAGKLEPAEPLLDTFNFNRILVIEDSATVIEQLARYLQELNIETVAHSRGEDALDMALEVQPDLILLDLQLPNLSGWHVLTQLKADARSANIPVIIISIVDERSRGLALGAAEYLVKPISRLSLRQILSRVARRQANTRPAPANLPKSSIKMEQPLILLAEDNEANIQLLADYLTEEGYRIVVARNGLEAIDRAREERPALILMDVQMPKLDGLEATRHIRANAELVKIPIIALTALAMPNDRERCLAAGMNDYMSKPVSLKSLIAMIETYLEPAKP